MGKSDARRSPWWVPSTLGVLLLAIGVGVLVAGLVSAHEHQVLTERGATADAVITSVDQDGRSLAATLTWTTATGHRVVEAGVQVDGPIVVGRHLTVVYDPRHPDDFVTGDVGDGYLAVLGLGALVALAGAAAVLHGTWGRRRQVQQRSLKTSGAPPRSRNAALLGGMDARSDGSRLTAEEVLAELNAGRRSRDVS